MWKVTLRKDILSHTTFFEGAKPTGAVNIDSLVDLAKKIVEYQMRQWKETPDAMTGYFRPFLTEKIAPMVKQWKQENPKITKKELKEKLKQENSKIRKEYIKYAFNKHKNKILNR
tara:strand:+ start:890 stop:1234 length:345 start_codon:yes stop_codon:yes gene_type:complete